MLGTDGWEASELYSLHLSCQSMVDGETVPNPIVVALGVLPSDFLQPFTPLRVWMFEGCSSTFGRLPYDDFGIVVLEDAKKADQCGVASRLLR
jgi:hypothetical protein